MRVSSWEVRIQRRSKADNTRLLRENRYQPFSRYLRLSPAEGYRGCRLAGGCNRRGLWREVPSRLGLRPSTCDNSADFAWKFSPVLRSLHHARVFALAVALLLNSSAGAVAEPVTWQREGWRKSDFSKRSVERHEISVWRTSKGWNSLYRPKFVPALGDTQLVDTEPVIGLEIHGDARATSAFGLPRRRPTPLWSWPSWA